MKSNDYIKINKQAYDSLWQDYKNRSIHKSSVEEKPDVLGGTILEFARKIFRRIKVLEVGPGSGEILNYFEKNNCQTLAVEISEKIANLAMDTSPNSKIINDDIMNVSFPESQFEIIYAGAVIHLFTLEDARIILRKFYKWLKPKGYMFINTTIHTSSSEGFLKKEDSKKSIIRYRRYWTEEELINELDNVDFSIKKRLFTDEKDRDKKWVAFIAQKVRE